MACISLGLYSLRGHPVCSDAGRIHAKGPQEAHGYSLVPPLSRLGSASLPCSYTIFSVAILETLKTPASELSGRLELDEDFFRPEASPSLSKYSLVLGTTPRRTIPAEIPDLNVAEDGEGVRTDSSKARRSVGLGACDYQKDTAWCAQEIRGSQAGLFPDFIGAVSTQQHCVTDPSA